MNQTVELERRPAEQTVGLLGSERRVAILRALAETPREAVPFADLRRRVGESDSGKFNYHLGKLTGSFVRRTEDGYELTLAGRQAVGALLAGTYTASVSIDPVPIDDPCPECGGDLRMTYADERVSIACTDCADWRSAFGVPPGVFEGYDRAALPEVADRYLRTLVARVVAGFCPVCDGRMDGRLEVDDEDLLEGADEPVLVYTCERCDEQVVSSLAMPLSYHPAVIALHWDHGIDLFEAPTWVASASHERSAALVSRDPPRATVRLSIDGDELTLTLDAALDVVSVERTRDGDADRTATGPED